MNKLAPLAAVMALAAGVAACSSSGSSSQGASGAKASTTPASGTETIYGKVTGAAALANNIMFHLTFTGPVGTTAMNALGGPPKKGESHTFTTTAGNLVVTLGSAGATAGGLKSPQTCLFGYARTVPFTVNGTKSTGKFAGATGTGTAVLAFSGDLPKLGNGKCDQSQNAQPSAKTAVSTFTATAALTIRR
jgi:hypothetical protein